MKEQANKVFTVVQMEKKHLKEVVDVHMSSFPSFFLTSLGPRFLNLLYQEIINASDGIALVCIQDNQVVGFVAGTLSQKGFYKKLIRTRLLQFGLVALPSTIQNPRIFPRLLRAIRQPDIAKEAPASALLMSIAVHPDTMGQGYGTYLVREFIEQLRANNIDKFMLTTDAQNNVRTNQFYQKLGFICIGTHTTPEGRQMNEYVMQLSTLSHPL